MSLKLGRANKHIDAELICAEFTRGPILSIGHGLVWNASTSRACPTPFYLFLLKLDLILVQTKVYGAKMLYFIFNYIVRCDP